MEIPRIELVEPQLDPGQRDTRADRLAAAGVWLRAVRRTVRRLAQAHCRRCEQRRFAIRQGDQPTLSSGLGCLRLFAPCCPC
eukprot:1980151-Rhodomonas_salina.2